jgi:sulfate adenylyltransferase subunit 1
VDKSLSLSWYGGEPLLGMLENLSIDNDLNLTHPRLPVQYVIRPQTPELHDYRGYAGKIMSGIYRKGDRVTLLPNGMKSRISHIDVAGKEVTEAFAGQSVIVQIEDDLDISRGDLIVTDENQPKTEQDLEVLLCWMDSKPLVIGNKYLLQIQSRRVRSVIKEIEYRLDVNSLERDYAPGPIVLNDIIKARIKTAAPVSFDSYDEIRANGSAILIDETSNVTVGACMIQ